MDGVGNSVPAGPFSGNKVDKKAPVVSCGSADGSWHAADVLIHCSASDGGSGIAAADQSFDLWTNVAGGTETDNAPTGQRAVTDGVNHTTTAGPVSGNKVDKKVPVFPTRRSSDLWHAANVLIHCSASDGGSGIAAADQSFDLSTNVAGGTETDNAATGQRDVTDGVNHTTTAGPVSGNKVDKKAPVVSCGSADTAWHAADVLIHCSASDGGSGLGEGE